MPKYLMLSTLSEQGLQTLRANPERVREVNKDVEELGATVVHQWFVLGPHDFVNIVEARGLERDRQGLDRARRPGERAYRSPSRCSRSTTCSASSPSRCRRHEPPRLPDWLAAEVAAWPQDAWGVHQTRVLLRDGSVIEPVAVLPSGDIVGWAVRRGRALPGRRHRRDRATRRVRLSSRP